jgi:prepilin-type N-terminal cleavage/methylation domain-containing protein
MTIASKPCETTGFTRRCGGFTLLEVVTALLILGTICTTVLTVINQAITTTIDLRKRTQAFETARENMENLLCLLAVSDTSDFGTHPLYPDIEWETTIEPFTEPTTNKMWIQAVCKASFPDSAGEIQTVTLTHWLTGLSDKQAQQILDQQKREGKYMDLLNANNETVKEQTAIREYLRQNGTETKEYDRILADQKRQKKQWIKEYPYDPDLFNGLMDSLRLKEYEWLDSIGFDRDSFDAWGRAQSPEFWAAIARRAGVSSAASGGSGSSSPDSRPSDTKGNAADGKTKPTNGNGSGDATNPDGTGNGDQKSPGSQDTSSSGDSQGLERPSDYNRWTPAQQQLWDDLIRRLSK